MWRQLRQRSAIPLVLDGIIQGGGAATKSIFQAGRLGKPPKRYLSNSLFCSDVIAHLRYCPFRMLAKENAGIAKKFQASV